MIWRKRAVFAVLATLFLVPLIAFAAEKKEKRIRNPWESDWKRIRALEEKLNDPDLNEKKYEGLSEKIDRYKEKIKDKCEKKTYELKKKRDKYQWELDNKKGERERKKAQGIVDEMNRQIEIYEMFRDGENPYADEDAAAEAEKEKEKEAEKAKDESASDSSDDEDQVKEKKNQKKAAPKKSKNKKQKKAADDEE